MRITKQRKVEYHTSSYKTWRTYLLRLHDSIVYHVIYTKVCYSATEVDRAGMLEESSQMGCQSRTSATPAAIAYNADGLIIPQRLQSISSLHY